VRACGRAGVRACGRAGVRACGRAGMGKRYACDLIADELDSGPLLTAAQLHPPSIRVNHTKRKKLSAQDVKKMNLQYARPATRREMLTMFIFTLVHRDVSMAFIDELVGKVFDLAFMDHNTMASVCFDKGANVIALSRQFVNCPEVSPA